MAPKSNLPSFWMRLDNAAKIYPAVQNEEFTAVFRLSCVLRQRVNARALVHAVRRIENRFPYYKVKPKKGFFWYYLEYQDESIPLGADLDMPCRAFGKHDLIFRVLARGRCLSVEFSHILTDGTGALEFLKVLLLSYFRECGFPVNTGTAGINPEDPPDADEFEDAFSRYFRKNVSSPRKKPRAFHLPFPLNDEPRFHVLAARLPLARVLEVARGHQVTITSYLVAVYLGALQRLFVRQTDFQKRRQRKIFRIQVPVNLRRMFPSKTMRNFSLFVTPEIDLSLGRYTFEEIVKTVHHILQLETDSKLISKIISRNVGAERNIWLKNTPLFIKSLILSVSYRIAGTSLYSGVITNLGKVTLGDADRFIDKIVFVPPPPNKTLKVNCGVLGFNDSLIVSFGNITRTTQLEKEFFSLLIEHGIPVRILNLLNGMPHGNL